MIPLPGVCSGCTGAVFATNDSFALPLYNWEIFGPFDRDFKCNIFVNNKPRIIKARNANRPLWMPQSRKKTFRPNMDRRERSLKGAIMLHGLYLIFGMEYFMALS